MKHSKYLEIDKLMELIKDNIDIVRYTEGGCEAYDYDDEDNKDWIIEEGKIIDVCVNRHHNPRNKIFNIEITIPGPVLKIANNKKR